MNLEDMVSRAVANRKSYRQAMIVPSSKKYAGVRKISKNKWEAYTNSSRGWTYIGCFDSDTEAAEARRKFLEKM
jgi:hypothetical protein